MKALTPPTKQSLGEALVRLRPFSPELTQTDFIKSLGSAKELKGASNSYEVLGLWKKTSNSEIYLGRDMGTGRLVVLKMSLSTDLKMLELAKREFEVGYRFNHPNVVTYIDYFLAEHCDILVSGLVRGITIRELKTETPAQLTRQEQLAISLGILDGLTYLHTTFPNPLIHRDLKPENIVFAYPGDGIVERPVIVDLGYMRTNSGTNSVPILSRGFTAPETSNPFDAVSVKSDLFSFGAVHLFLRSGASALDVIQGKKVNHEKLTSLGLDPLDIRIIEGCLQYDAAAREFGSAKEIRDILAPNMEVTAVQRTISPTYEVTAAPPVTRGQIIDAELIVDPRTSPILLDSVEKPRAVTYPARLVSESLLKPTPSPELEALIRTSTSNPHLRQQLMDLKNLLRISHGNICLRKEVVAELERIERNRNNPINLRTMARNLRKLNSNLSSGYSGLDIVISIAAGTAVTLTTAELCGVLGTGMLVAFGASILAFVTSYPSALYLSSYITQKFRLRKFAPALRQVIPNLKLTDSSNLEVTDPRNPGTALARIAGTSVEAVDKKVKVPRWVHFIPIAFISKRMATIFLHSPETFCSFLGSRQNVIFKKAGGTPEDVVRILNSGYIPSDELLGLFVGQYGVRAVENLFDDEKFGSFETESSVRVSKGVLAANLVDSRDGVKILVHLLIGGKVHLSNLQSATQESLKDHELVRNPALLEEFLDGYGFSLDERKEEVDLIHELKSPEKFYKYLSSGRIRLDEVRIDKINPETVRKILVEFPFKDQDLEIKRRLASRCLQGHSGFTSYILIELDRYNREHPKATTPNVSSLIKSITPSDAEVILNYGLHKTYADHFPELLLKLKPEAIVHLIRRKRVNPYYYDEAALKISPSDAMDLLKRELLPAKYKILIHAAKSSPQNAKDIFTYIIGGVAAPSYRQWKTSNPSPLPETEIASMLTPEDAKEILSSNAKFGADAASTLVGKIIEDQNALAEVLRTGRGSMSPDAKIKIAKAFDNNAAVELLLSGTIKDDTLQENLAERVATRADAQKILDSGTMTCKKARDILRQETDPK